MPSRVDEHGNIIIPKGETFGFTLRNLGTHEVREGDRATLSVEDKDGEAVFRWEADVISGGFRFYIPAGETAHLNEGVYMYDVIIETAETEREHALRKTLYAPQLRKFVIGRVTDDGPIW